MTVGELRAAAVQKELDLHPCEQKKDESTQHKRRQSGRSAPAAAHFLEQRQPKRARLESTEESSQDGRKRLSLKRASEAGAEGLEPENSERDRAV